MRYLTIPVLLAAVFITGCVTVDRRSGPQAVQASQITPAAVVVSTEPAAQQTPNPPAAAEAPKIETQPAPSQPATGGETQQSQPTAEAVSEAAPPAEQRMHKVWINESLWSIARKYYGDGRLWTLIYEANKDQIVTAKKIFPKQMLIIPENGN